jgi:sec-independent protein translocase protein TatA
MPNVGPTELLILLVILLVVFGPKRLPGLGKQLGSGMRDFKEAVTSRHDDDDDDGESPRALPAATATSEPVATTATSEPVAVPTSTSERNDRDA